MQNGFVKSFLAGFAAKALTQLCCMNPVRDSSCESSMLAGGMSRPTPPTYKTRNWPSYKRSAEAPRLADDLVRSRHDVGSRTDRQARAAARLW